MKKPYYFKIHDLQLKVYNWQSLKKLIQSSKNCKIEYKLINNYLFWRCDIPTEYSTIFCEDQNKLEELLVLLIEVEGNTNLTTSNIQIIKERIEIIKELVQILKKI